MATTAPTTTMEATQSYSAATTVPSQQRKSHHIHASNHDAAAAP